MNLNEKEVILKCLEENFKHARHQEIQRNKLNYLYFVVWGAILSLYASGLSERTLLFVFVFLFIFSIIVFFATLKWNAEFTNHISAIAKISFDLNINNAEKNKMDNEEKLTLSLYPSYKGYLGLPLHIPMIFSVSVLYVILHSLGITISGVLICKIMGIHNLCVLILLSVFLFSLLILISKFYYNKISQQIKERYSLTNLLDKVK